LARLLLRGGAEMPIRRDGPEETYLRLEIESRVRELQRAVSSGEPPVHWKARRNEIDDLWSRLLKAREERMARPPASTSKAGDRDGA
jgi:hypothetical protein